jgi:hypothetical protein
MARGSVDRGGIVPSNDTDAGWSLHGVRSIGSPIGDPTGITFDGEQLWLLDGGQNSMTNRLVRYDDNAYVITRDFTLDNLIEVLGTGAYGIAWDGTDIWISVSGNRNKLVAVDPQTGAVVRTWGSPTTLGPSDLEFDGALMWISDGLDRVFAMDLSNGAIQSSFSTTPAFIRNNGVAIRAGEVFVNGLFNEGIGVFTKTGTLLGSEADPRGPMCFARGQLVSVAGGQIHYDNAY